MLESIETCMLQTSILEGRQLRARLISGSRNWSSLHDRAHHTQTCGTHRARGRFRALCTPTLHAQHTFQSVAFDGLTHVLHVFATSQTFNSGAASRTRPIQAEPGHGGGGGGGDNCPDRFRMSVLGAVTTNAQPQEHSQQQQQQQQQ